MAIFRTFGLAAASLLLALTAAAQTPTTHLPTHRVKRLPGTKPGAADPQRATSPRVKGGNNVYAAPGEPVNVRENGKNTPPYDGPAAGHAAKAAEAAKADKSTTIPR